MTSLVNCSFLQTYIVHHESQQTVSPEDRFEEIDGYHERRDNSQDRYNRTRKDKKE